MLLIPPPKSLSINFNIVYNFYVQKMLVANLVVSEPCLFSLYALF